MNRSKRKWIVAGVVVSAAVGSLAFVALRPRPHALQQLPPSTAPALAAAAAMPVPPGARAYELRSEGLAALTITAPLETIRGETRAAGGRLDVDLADIARSRGEVDVDLGAFTTHTFNDPGRDTTQTEHARSWFEIGPDVPAERREALRWARFVIDSIDGVSAHSFRDAPVVRDGDMELRTVSLTAHGRLTVHGIVAAKDVALDVTARTHAGAMPDAPPDAIAIRTHAPFPVRLRQHDVRARDTAGALVTNTFRILGQRVGEDAMVTLDLTAVAPEAR